VTGTTTNLTTGLVTVNGSPAPLPLSFTVQGFENVIGSNFADSITGNTANNSLSGGAGNDTLDGGVGNDSLLGGLGNDSLVGGSGLDTLIGVNALNANAGTNEIDTLTGGAIDSDRFVLADTTQLYYRTTSAAAFGVNDYAKITDFQSGVDKLVLKSGINYFTTSASPVAGITGNFFIFRDNAALGTLNAADDLVAAIAGTFSGADVILV
jgi:Ca2+-binding RTX toxin-like protein